MKDKRRYPRFDVSQMPELKMAFALRPKAQLVMIGQGGCGFFSSILEEVLKDHIPVECSFAFEGVLQGPVVMTGQIAYSQPLQVGRDKKLFYGIDFDNHQDEKLRPLLQHLEGLAAKGKIKSR